MMLDPPEDAGELEIDGIRPWAADVGADTVGRSGPCLAARRSRVGMVFQQFQPVSAHQRIAECDGGAAQHIRWRWKKRGTRAGEGGGDLRTKRRR